jgi:hypothetical protein
LHPHPYLLKFEVGSRSSGVNNYSDPHFVECAFLAAHPLHKLSPTREEVDHRVEASLVNAGIYMRFYYPEEAGYNPQNPQHGLQNPELKDALKAEVEKLLVFLVQGARDWYQSGKRLLDMPEASKRYMESWEQANDPFAAFLKEEGTMNVKAFETTDSLMQAYNDSDRLVDGVRFEETEAPRIRTPTELGKFCKDHGLEGPGKPSEIEVRRCRAPSQRLPRVQAQQIDAQQ